MIIIIITYYYYLYYIINECTVKYFYNAIQFLECEIHTKTIQTQIFNEI